MIKYEKYQKTKNLSVDQIASSLRAFLNLPNTQTEIHKVHQLGSNSQLIQKIIESHLIQKDFVSERKGLFKNYNLRPDLYNKQHGIIVEVERGKIKSNNMHLLDMFKCHLAEEAKHLFLIIPNERQRTNKKPEAIFDSISKVLSSFFEPNSYINVESVHIFGY